MGQTAKKQPLFYQGESGVDADGIFRCACFSMHLPEATAVKYAASYIINIVNASVEHRCVNDFLTVNYLRN